MAVRFRKYFQECKPIQCTGRRSRQCPETPKRSNGEYKACGVWCVEFFDDNKQWQSLTFKDIRNKTDAERRLTLFISDRERGQLNLPRKKNIPSLKEYSETYLECYKAAKENTFASKKRVVNALVEYLGDYRLDKITPFVIEKYRIDRKGKVKDGTINDDITVLSHVFTTAIKAGIIGNNPCKDVKRLKVTQVKDRILSQAEIALLLDRLQGKDRLMVLVGLFTGLRLGGVLSLSWHDIDFTSGIITSSHKTGKLVSIPLSGYLRNALETYGKHSAGDMVFEVRALTCAVVVEYSTHFSALFKRLGIHNFTFHNLRHTFSSILQGELGIGAVVVQGMTGHSSLGMLQKYSHTGLDNKRTAIQALTDHVLNTGKKVALAIAQ